MAILLTNCAVLDGTGAGLRPETAVLVEGERIAEIGEASGLVERSPEAERVDLGGATLIPGLLNLHVHLGLTLPGQHEFVGETVPALTLRMAANAEAALRAG